MPSPRLPIIPACRLCPPTSLLPRASYLVIMYFYPFPHSTGSLMMARPVALISSPLPARRKGECGQVLGCGRARPAWEGSGQAGGARGGRGGGMTSNASSDVSTDLGEFVSDLEDFQQGQDVAVWTMKSGRGLHPRSSSGICKAPTMCGARSRTLRPPNFRKQRPGSQPGCVASGRLRASLGSSLHTRNMGMASPLDTADRDTAETVQPKVRAQECPYHWGQNPHILKKTILELFLNYPSCLITHDPATKSVTPVSPVMQALAGDGWGLPSPYSLAPQTLGGIQ